MALADAAVLASYETERFALDKPMCVVQAIPLSPTYAKWVDAGQIGAGSIATWTDRSATANPARRAYDGQPGFVTKHSGVTADDVYYYALDLGAEYYFDCVLMIGHNAGTLGLAQNLVVQTSDNNAFTSNLTTVADFGKPANNDRLADLDLTSSKRYLARYVWVKFDKTGTNIIPEIGELILGRRRQLQYRPDMPYTLNSLHNETEQITTIGGVRHKAVYYRNQFVLNASFLVDGVTYAADWVSLFSDARGSFVWIDAPSSAPASWHLIDRDPDDLEMELIASSTYRANLAGYEMGPSGFFLKNE
jgi:hypothetical protein